ncbi:MAG: bifunctional UDP-sugar hydrolase/5'-nucleotidase [Vicinamibacterales bacterium]
MSRGWRVRQGVVVVVAAVSGWTLLAAPRQPTVPVQLLAFNDYHGNLEPPAGSNGRIGQTVAGGVEFLASHIAALKATNPNTIVVSAGDNIGATPLLSGLFHDEPAIESLNTLGLQVSAVGNHELDEGWWELWRMARGGCHPTDGCQDGTPYGGARFQFLAANVTVTTSQVSREHLAAAGWKRKKGVQTLFPPSTVRSVGGVKVGFIGLTLEGTPRIVMPASLEGLTFHPEAAAANAEVVRLRKRGVRAIVVLIHEGGVQQGSDPNGCDGLSGAIVPIVEALSPEVDVVVSGHTHKSYVCTLAGKLVTSAESYSRIVTDIDLDVDRKTGEVVARRARNVVATRDVPPDAAETRVIGWYKPLAARVGERQVGTVAATVDQAVNDAGESAIGQLVADAMLEGSRDPANGGAEVAFTNSGGVRAEITRAAGTPAGQPAPVTFAMVSEVLPFGNITVVKTMTGDALVRLLEEQFDRPDGRPVMLQVSHGFSYAFDPSKPAGQKVDRASVMLNGRPIGPGDRVRVASVDFVWNGGDRFTVVKEGTDPTTVIEVLDQLIAYLGKHSPISPGPRGRVRRIS